MAKNTPGVDSSSISNDARLKIKTIASYNDNAKNQLNQFVLERENAIIEAENKIKSEKEAINKSKERVIQLTNYCENEGNNLHNVLMFFGTSDSAKDSTPE
jgi:hypothetical protein